MKLRTVADVWERLKNKVLDTEIVFGWCGVGHRVVVEKECDGDRGVTRTGRRVRLGAVALTIPISSSHWFILRPDPIVEDVRKLMHPDA